MLGAETVSALKHAVSIAQSIRAAIDTPSNTSPPIVTLPDYQIDFDNYHLPYPQSLISHLLKEGIPSDIAEKINNSYLRASEVLKSQTEAIFRKTCAKLLTIPQSPNLIPLAKLCDQIFDIQRRSYLSTLSQWEQEAIGIATSRIAARKEIIEDTTPEISTSPETPPMAKKSKRFKSEYLPLFEYAFSKDRFPSREDKKHLARISSMSYRQVSVWFQNRRCRTAAKAKASRATSTPTPAPTAPQTLEEVKEGLGASARASLDGWRVHAKASEGVLQERTAVDPITTVVDSAVRTRAPLPVLALEPIEEPVAESGVDDDGYDSEELFREELFCEEGEEKKGRSSSPVDELERGNSTFDPARIPLPESPTATPSPSPSPAPVFSRRPLVPAPALSAAPSHHLFNPLNPPASNTFPAVYSPSRPTFDPFVVEQTPWLRHPAERRTRMVDPTPEVIDEILGSLESMEVVSMPWKKEQQYKEQQGQEQQQQRRPQRPLPRRGRNGFGIAGLSAAMPGLSRDAGVGSGVARTCSGSSSSSSSISEYASLSLGGGSSSSSSSSCCASAPASRFSSYSVSSCSTFSTPQFSERELPLVDDAYSTNDDGGDGDDDDDGYSGRYKAGSLDVPVKSVSGDGSAASVTESGTPWEQLVSAATSVDVVYM